MLFYFYRASAQQSDAELVCYGPVSVCPSVTVYLLQVGVLSKRLNLGLSSCSERRTIAKGLVLWCKRSG